MSSLDIQVGGGHYKSFAIQPVEFICANSWGYIQGNVLKYLTRHAMKNGRADLEKANHYVDLGNEVNSQFTLDLFPTPEISIDDFIAANAITDDLQIDALRCLEAWVRYDGEMHYYTNLKSAITRLIIEKYPIDN